MLDVKGHDFCNPWVNMVWWVCALVLVLSCTSNTAKSSNLRFWADFDVSFSSGFSKCFLALRSCSLDGRSSAFSQISVWITFLRFGTLGSIYSWHCTFGTNTNVAHKYKRSAPSRRSFWQVSILAPILTSLPPTLSTCTYESAYHHCTCVRSKKTAKIWMSVHPDSHQYLVTYDFKGADLYSQLLRSGVNLCN